MKKATTQLQEAQRRVQSPSTTMNALRMTVELMRRESPTQFGRSGPLGAPSSYKNKAEASVAIVAALTSAKPRLLSQVLKLLPEVPRHVQFEPAE